MCWPGCCPRQKAGPERIGGRWSSSLLDAALDFQEALFDAQSQGGTTRQKHLREADAALNKLRLYLRLAHHWRWLTDGQYQHVSVMVAELGRLLGGWMKKS